MESPAAAIRRLSSGMTQHAWCRNSTRLREPGCSRSMNLAGSSWTLALAMGVPRKAPGDLVEDLAFGKRVVEQERGPMPGQPPPAAELAGNLGGRELALAVGDDRGVAAEDHGEVGAGHKW